MLFDSQSFLSTVTSKPGVYRMYDSLDTVIYVGKAINLKKRLSSYFSKTHSGLKTSALVENIAKIEVTVTQTEVEALLLECNLIKRFQPKYNVLLRDDKTYPYIHVTLSQPFPRIERCRTKKKPTSSDYFGPYISIEALNETLNILQKVFKLRTCRDSMFKTRSRPCLQYQIKRCTAPCVGFISEQDYQLEVKHAVEFLQGKQDTLIQKLIKEMDLAIQDLGFEKAALIRDQIAHLRQTQSHQGITKARGNIDFIALEMLQTEAVICLVLVRDGQVMGHELFFPTLPSENTSLSEVCHAFFSHYYFIDKDRIPSNIIFNQENLALVEMQTELEAIANKKVTIQTKVRGDKANWLKFANENLSQAIAHRLQSTKLIKERYLALQTYLGLRSPIKRMECFDISHTQGQYTKASCVVFDASGPLKRAYRQYNIQGITPGDDYAAMEQALIRRFSPPAKKEYFPDLLLIDGGKAQVKIAQTVLDNLNMDNVAILGIAKGRDRKAGFERVIWQGGESTLPMTSNALHLLQHIRDEAHRFAITKHREKREKKAVSSILSNIEGVGEKRRQLLLKHFGGLKGLEKASMEDILKVPGISLKVAESVFSYFREV